MPGFEYRADLSRTHRVRCKIKSPVLAHLPRGTQKSAESGPKERAADAHAPDTDGRQIRQTQLHSAEAHHHVDRPVNRADHRGDIFLGGKAWSIENVRAGLLIRLEARNRIFYVR